MLERINNQQASTATSGKLFYIEFFYDTYMNGIDDRTMRSNRVPRRHSIVMSPRPTGSRLGNGIIVLTTKTTMAGNSYGYNIYNELTVSDYHDYDVSSNLVSTSKFDEFYNYHKNGDISTMSRKGSTGVSIDVSGYTYQSNTNRLIRVSDFAPAATSAQGFNRNGQPNSGAILTYDLNDDFMMRSNRVPRRHSIVKSPRPTGSRLGQRYYRDFTSSITYNHLDLPTVILKTDGSKLEMTYSANGELLRRRTYLNGGVLSETKDYIGNYEFINNVLESINHSQGRYKRVSTAFRHEYVLADQVGSTRIVYSDINGDDNITVSDIIDENHYYAYGLEYTGSGYINGGYPYKFNGIERVESYNMDFALYRGLDPILGRWYQVDPKAEQAGYHMSPYCAMGKSLAKMKSKHYMRAVSQPKKERC